MRYNKLPDEYDISPSRLEGWMSGTNKAPRNHEGLLKLAAKIGVTVEEMFV
jgi:hypothetical protein